MCFSLQQTYNACARGEFSHPDPELCGCRGGWFLSDLDTWHKCPEHYENQRHPEAYEYIDCEACLKVDDRDYVCPGCKAEIENAYENARRRLAAQNPQVARLVQLALKGDYDAAVALKRAAARGGSSLHEMGIEMPPKPKTAEEANWDLYLSDGHGIPF